MAGTVTANGYTQVQVDGVFLKAHRVVWFAARQEPPPFVIDHASQARNSRGALSNAIGNLRAADYFSNSANRVGSRNSRTGVKGVTIVRRNAGAVRYAADIREDGKVRHLGLFLDPVAAWLHRVAAAERTHGFEFMRESSPPGMDVELLQAIGEARIARKRKALDAMNDESPKNTPRNDRPSVIAATSSHTETASTEYLP